MFRPKKSFGQNFLVNPHTINKIISFSDLKPNDIVLEIGPGKGALTHQLAKHTKKVIAIEKDKQLAQQLKKQFIDSNVQIIEANFLSYSIKNLPKISKVVGNLPYNIATPIIEKLIEHKSKFSEMFFTVQLEHGLRMTAKPHTKSYGSFSCFIQYHTLSKKLFNIKNTCFYPKPKVQSCFVSMQINKNTALTKATENFLFKMIQCAFQQRRKMIVNSLVHFADKEMIFEALEKTKIRNTSRAENLTLHDYIALSKILMKLQRKG